MWLNFRRVRVMIAAAIASGLVGMSASAAIAQASSGSLTVTINAQYSPSLLSLLEQARSLAQRTITQQFQANPSLTEVYVTVLAERNRQVVPLLTSQVTRADWQTLPEVAQWVRYSGSSAVLLGFGGESTPVATAPRRPASGISGGSPIALNDPVQELERAFRDGDISEQEFNELRDEWD